MSEGMARRTPDRGSRGSRIPVTKVDRGAKHESLRLFDVTATYAELPTLDITPSSPYLRPTKVRRHVYMSKGPGSVSRRV